MAEDYGVTLKITADTSDLDQIPQKVESTRKEIERPVEQTVVEKRVVENVQRLSDSAVKPATSTAEPLNRLTAERTETVKIKEEREPAAPVEHSAETVPLKEQREAAAPVEHPAETVKVEERREAAAPVEHPAETVAVQERREPAAPVEHPAETVKVKQDPNPLKPKVEKPAPVKIEAKADKVRVEVEDAEAKKTIADLKADARLKVTADTRQAVGSFNALKAAMDVLHGNFAGLAMEISKLSNGAGMLKTIGVSGFLAIGGAIMGVVSLARSLRDLFATMFNTNTVGRDISSLGSRLVDIRNEAENFASAMDDARKAADLVNQSLEKEISALGRVAKAQSEINRQRELAAASSDDERADINSRYDRQAIDIGANTAQQSEEAKRKAITDEIDRLKKAIEQSDVTISAYNRTARAARQRADFYRGPNSGTVFGGMVDSADSIVSGFVHKKTDLEKAEAASTVATNAQNAADDEIERKAALEEALEKKLHELKMADLDAEARKAEQKAEKEKNAAEKAVREKQKAERQNDEQDKFARERGKSAADAEFEDRMRAEQRKASAPNATEADRSAAENAQIAMLRGREQQAQADLAAAKQQLADELKKPATERDETVLSRAREDIREADSTALSSRRQREDIEQTVTDRRATVEQDYFGRLARQIEASRPKNRLTAMGLGSGAPGDSRIAAENANNVKQLVEISRQLLAATRDNKPSTVAVFAP